MFKIHLVDKDLDILHVLVKFLFYLLCGKNLIPNLKTKYCRCCCVGWMELGQILQLLHVKTGVKHFLITFCFAIGIVKRLIMWNNTDKWKYKPGILQVKVAQISQKTRQNEAITISLKTYRACLSIHLAL